MLTLGAHFFLTCNGITAALAVYER